jgi:hypothetical protein
MGSVSCYLLSGGWLQLTKDVIRLVSLLNRWASPKNFPPYCHQGTLLMRFSSIRSCLTRPNGFQARPVATLLATALLFTASASMAIAAPLTGTYDTRTADGSKTVTPGDTVGPWQLTSTDATASWVRFTFDAPPTFGDLTDLNVVFFSPELNAQVNSDGPIAQAVANAGGGGGAPRLTLALDSDGDMFADKFFDIHLGSSPGFVDSPAALNTFSGMNLIGNNDTGRYDLSSAGGSVFTDYSAALALAGTWTVLRETVFLDSFGGADKTLGLTSINGSSVPEPSSVVLAGLGLIGLAAWGWRRKR